MATVLGFELFVVRDALVVLAAGLVAAGLYRERPAVGERTVLALSPWMVVGAALYVCYQIGLVPDAVAPLTRSPVVYLSTFAVAGAVWLAALHRRGDPDRVVAWAGGLATVVPVAAALLDGATTGTLTVAWPAVALVVSVAGTAAVWYGVRRFDGDTAAVTGGVGALAVFGHALDGVSTAVGVDVLGFGERTPASRAILEFAGGLPTAPALGSGWLFVLVKLALAVVVVHLFREYVREEPAEGNLLLGVVAAVGLGPGAHNLLLYAVAQPTLA